MNILLHSSRIIADSISLDGVRLTTLEVKLPRIVLAEFNTHRVFSRNSASSRAIPIEKMLSMVLSEPYIPSEWGKNQRGMQADELVSDELASLAAKEWEAARDSAIKHVERLLELGIHKQITNRLLEPFMWHTILCTSTEWDNFWHLRNHKDAHPDIRMAAEKMQEAYEASTPKELKQGHWHLPLVYDEDWDIVENTPGLSPADAIERLKKISIGRCARVSYLTHDGKRDHEKDIELYERLYIGGHMSPFEHVARPLDLDEDLYEYPLTVETGSLATYDLNGDWNGGNLEKAKAQNTWAGNLRGWLPYRKTIQNEWDLLGARAEAAE